MRVLLTGAGGFVGPHLTRALEAAGAEVHCAGFLPNEAEHQVDVTDVAATTTLLAKVRPEAVVHLAGLSSVAECAKHPMRAFQVNAGGTLSIAQAILSLKAKCRLLCVSSGEVYGASATADPLGELVPADPITVYGATKRSGEILALQHRHLGLDVVIARPFNHIGPGQTPTFVLPSFAHQLVRAPRGMAVALEVGNLSAVRDFSHVSDVVDAYVVLLEKGEPGQIYNVGSGTGQSIEELLWSLVSLSGRRVTVTVDAARVRPVEIPTLVCDGAKLRALGWSPKHTVNEALAEVLAEAEDRHEH